MKLYMKLNSWAAESLNNLNALQVYASSFASLFTCGFL